MKYLIALILLLDPPALHVVPSVDTVMPGQLFSVTITQFGDVGEVTFDSGGLEVVSDTLAGNTRYVWLRAAGPARDVRVRAWGAGVSSEAWVRVCCKVTAFPGRQLYFPVFRR